MLTTHRAEGRRRATRLLFLVHNYGGNEFAMALLGQLVDPGGRFAVVCPRGGLPTPDVPSGASFYRIDRATHTYDEPSFAAAMTALDDTLDETCRQGGFDRAEAVIGGFSQGAGLALALAYRRSDRSRPAGVMAFNAPVHPPERVPWDLGAAATVPAFLAHGTADRTFPIDAARHLARRLAEAGGDVVWREYPAGHQVTVEALSDARDWLALR